MHFRFRIFFVILAAVLFGCVTGRRRRHFGPKGSQSSVHLKGLTVGKSTSAEIPNKNLLVKFDVELKRDIVVWDELKTDGVHITACSSEGRNGEASLGLRGKMLDMSDYSDGTAFVIDVDDWERRCGEVKPMKSIDSSDQYLFFIIIDGVKSKGKQVNLQLRRVPGSKVAPKVDFEVMRDVEIEEGMIPNDLCLDDDPNFAAIDESLMGTSRSYILSNSTLLPYEERFLALRKSFDVDVVEGVTATVELGFDACITNFRFIRSAFGIPQLGWDQNLEASVTGKLAFGILSKRKEIELLKPTAIPNFGYSTDIFLLGKVSAGAFFKADWVLDVSAEATVELSMEASVKTEQSGLVHLTTSPTILVRSKEAKSGSVAAQGTFTDGAGAAIKGHFEGFVGVRPAVGVEISLERFKKRGVELYVGVDLGAQVVGEVKYPPFEAVTGDWVTVGNCDDCHLLEGTLSMVAKNLSYAGKVNGKTVVENTLLNQILNFPIGSGCAISAQCS